MMIRNIIWDVDGTLFDTYPAFVAAFRDVLNCHGVQLDDESILSLVKVSIGHAVKAIAQEYSLEPERVQEEFWAEYARQPYAAQPPFPGLERVCRLICDRGGKNVIVTHRGMESSARLLHEHGLEAYFADIVSLGCGYARKPNPEMYRVAMERNGLKPEETLAVGDREIDIQAGAAAGIRTCAFQPVELPSSADWLIESYEALVERLTVDERAADKRIKTTRR